MVITLNIYSVHEQMNMEDINIDKEKFLCCGE